MYPSAKLCRSTKVFQLVSKVETSPTNVLWESGNVPTRNNTINFDIKRKQYIFWEKLIGVDIISIAKTCFIPIVYFIL